MQDKRFSPEHKTLLLAVLHFETLMWENCTNRSIYNSYEHLSELLLSTDLDVLQASLRLILRPAQRLGTQRSLKAALESVQIRVAVIAQHWGTEQFGITIPQIMDEATQFPPESKSVSYQFYRTIAAGTLSEEKSQNEVPVTPIKSKGTKGSTVKSSVDKLTDGLTTIHLPDAVKTGQPAHQILTDLCDTYSVPEEHRFPLLHRIRLAAGMQQPSVRGKLLTIRLLAIATLVIMVPEDVIQSKLLTYEPNLINQIADLLQKEGGIPKNEMHAIQTAAIFALDSFSHHRNYLGPVLTALAASANHGTLMYLLRKMVASVNSNEHGYPMDYMDALLAFLTYIATTQTGGNMIITAGIMPILIQLLSNSFEACLKTVTRGVVLLDTLVFGFSTAFTPFADAHGLDILVTRIKEEVDYGLSVVGADPMDGVQTTTGDISVSHELSHERITLLRGFFKFVMHMMQTSGTADRMRNLIDSSLPGAILDVFKHPHLFTAAVFGLAINVMSTFIHNEPTSLAILQESHLPQVLLEAVMKDIPVSCEVVSAIPNAFGAMCLNQAGLDEFNEVKPMERYLGILIVKENIRMLQDNDVPNVVGSSLDELMRHHPTLKDDVLSAIMSMLRKVVETCTEASPDDMSGTQLQVLNDSVDLPTDAPLEGEKAENITADYVDMMSRFLEGLFQNTAHCKDFIKMDGVQVLLRFYSLPTLPYDFVSTGDSYSLSYIFRLMMEVNPTHLVSCLLSEIQRVLEAVKPLLDYDGDDALVARFLDMSPGDSHVAEGQALFRALVTLEGFVQLLSDVYSRHGMSHSKSVAAIVQMFTGEFGGTLIHMLGKVYRSCVWENILLKSAVPKAWYQTATKKSSDKAPSDMFGTPRPNPSLDVNVLDSVLAVEPSSEVKGEDLGVDEKDRRVKNTRYFRHLLTKIPAGLTPTLQSIIKPLCSKRINDAGSRKAGQSIVDSIANMLREHLSWGRPHENQSLDKYSYLAVVLGCTSVMFTEDRPGINLQTNVIAAFHATGGFNDVMKVVELLWADAEDTSRQISSGEFPDMKLKLDRIHGALDLALNILQTVCNDKLLHESPATVTMITRERDKTSPDYFDPFQFVINVRLEVAQLIIRLWRSSYLTQAPANIIKSVVAIVTHLLRADGEVNNRPERAATAPTAPLGSLAASIFGRPVPVVPDGDRIQQLVDMGFPRPAAELALTRCGNHVARAAEYLLTHPHVGSSTTTRATQPDDAAPPTGSEVTSEAPSVANATADSAQPVEGVTAELDSGADMDSQTSDRGGDNDLEAALALSMGPTDEIEDAQQTTTAETMDVDLPADEPVEANIVDKGKAAQTSKDELDIMRDTLRGEVIQRSIELLDHAEDVIFSIKDLLCLAGKDDMGGVFQALVAEVEQLRGLETESPQASAKSLAVRLRLIALMVNDSSLQLDLFAASKDWIQIFIKLASSDGTCSPWLASVLLILEAYISISDEPKVAELQYGRDAHKPSSNEESRDPLKPLSVEDRMQLMGTVVALLKLDTIDKDLLHAILRLTVRLTRAHSMGVEFVRLGGVPLLFETCRIGLYQTQPAMTIMILRHIVEDTEVLKRCMEREVTGWFANSRSRVIDIPTFIKNNAHLIHRDPDTFVEAISKVAKLTRYDPFGRHQQITLKDTQTVSENVVGTDVEHNTPITGTSQDTPAENVLNIDVSGSEPLAEPVVSMLSDISEGVVHYLVTEILALKNGPTLVTGTLLPGDSAGGSSEQPAINAEEVSKQRVHLRRCFLLQCLAELVVSYPTCKLDVISISPRRPAKGIPHKGASAVRSPFLSYLVHDLLPLGSIATMTPANDQSDGDLQRKTIESNWVASVITALCLSATKDLADEKQQFPELVNVRRCVLDVIGRNMRDAVGQCDETTSTRYARFMVLSDICQKILTARGPAVGGAIRATTAEDEIHTQLARAMLEKNYVSILTQMLGEIDIHHPESKTLLGAVLGPLESLTKIAIQLGKAHENRGSDTKLESDTSLAIDTANFEENPSEGNAELSDLYRNSALGMFNAPTSEDDDEISSDESGEDDFDEYTSEDMSEIEGEDEEEGSDVDDDMEIMMPQPYQGNHEPSSDEEGEDSEEVEEEEGDQGSDGDSEGPVQDGMSWTADDVQYHDVEGGPDSAGVEPAGVDMMVLDEQAVDVDHGDDDRSDDEGDADEVDDDSDEGSPELEDMYDDPLADGDDDEEGLWGDGGRDPFARFGILSGSRRTRTRRAGRRQGLEPNMPSAAHLDITWVTDDASGYRGLPGDFEVLGRPIAGRGAITMDDSMSHPLISNTPQGLPGQSRAAPNARSRVAAVRSGDVVDWQAFDELIGRDALQILEQFFIRSGRPATNELRLEVDLPDGSMPNIVADLPLRMRRGSVEPVVGLSSDTKETSPSSLLEQQVAAIHAFFPLGTAERWLQEAKLMYGNVMQEKAAKIVNSVLNELIPVAMEEDKLKKERDEQERKAKEEQERQKREEEERLQKEKEEQERVQRDEEDRQRRELEGSQTVVNQEAEMSDVQPIAEVGNERSMQESSSTPVANANERVVVMVNGAPVDITGSGIDVEFLEALPDDLRQEVISEHFREQQRSRETPVDSSNISSEFLDALPPDIREEVLEEQRRAARRQERVTNETNVEAEEPGRSELDPAGFLATLDPHLRQTVLMEQDDMFLATLPPALVAEANVFRQNLSGNGGFARTSRGLARRALPGNGAQMTGAAGAKRLSSREAVHLLDKPALVILLRLLFLPEPIAKPVLHRIILNLCQNSKTRGELISLLLGILLDENADMMSSEKPSQPVTPKGKGKQPGTPGRKGLAPMARGLAMENIPNLAGQRALEALSQLVAHNDAVVRFFLAEAADVTIIPANKTPKKGKGKERGNEFRYPVVVLLSLLERPVFLENPTLMEQLMHTLSVITRPLPTLNQRDDNKREHGQKVESDLPTAENTSSASETLNASSDSSSTAAKKSTGTTSTTLPPTFPENYVSAVVNALTSGACSGKTFQYTLLVIQQLASTGNNRDIITRELAASAQRLGDSMIPDLDELVNLLHTTSSVVDVQGATLSRFSPATATQAKLLRVLKTLDFVYSKAVSSVSSDTAAKSVTTDLSDVNVSKSVEGTSRPLDGVPVVLDPLTSLYDKMQFVHLWKRLGECLAAIASNEALVHVATVLLPLIESFMVVSKPYVIKQKSSQTLPSVSRTSTRQSSDLSPKNNADLFYAFTDEHRKTLNTMVRNSPSLMSGSFSLLVQNPKVLEFDNKRTYFNLQLHKRTGREHYGTLQINVRRQYVFEDSYHQLHGRTGEEIKYSKLSVRFYEEEGVDAGGVTREWFSVLARQMFNPDYALFRPSAVDRVTYQPNRLSEINPDHLLYFKFVGRVIAKAIYDGRLLDAYFTRSFYKAMIDAPVDYKDMEAVDPEFHKSLEWILQNDITDVLDLTFSTEIDKFGKKEIAELKPGGTHIAVTEDNKHEYVKLVVEQRLVTAIREQIDAFLSGFNEIIPKNLCKIFNEQELELLISGMPDIDIDDWKNNTEYQNYSPSSPQIQWFWRAVRSLSQEEKAKLLQFATGTSKVPLEGFSQLQGSSGVQKFQIHKDFSSTERLPSAHTCFNQLDLPAYDSYEQLRACLLLAITEAGTGFGFA
ncbi:hypothetical protein HDU85_004001 [Gaertneriomyces sp. JEL0708]|nr:hypothetical protein HDU85_004001 [Gaertneriomyces sp. JEL0708]